MTKERENLTSRLGFILVSAGCAIGLGNIWRFPFIVGEYGGCIFVLLYLLFLLLMGFPLLMVEMSIGRGSHSNLVQGLPKLANKGKKFWCTLGVIASMGCLLLMMYYTTVTGWLLTYTGDYLTGAIAKGTADGSTFGDFFGVLVSDPKASGIGMFIACAIGGIVCSLGLKNGVESFVKYMMALLLILMGILAVRVLFLPNAMEGLKFYLLPNWQRFTENPYETIFAAMGQAFFTLSIGVGSMEIFGSYLPWKKSLAKECAWIIILDTFVALAAGLIIFPACTSSSVDVSSGPGLIFISLPNVFTQIAGGRFWGFLFFAFLSLAALTTVIAVFENLLALLIDIFHWKRITAGIVVGLAVAALSIPCVLGFNLWSSFQPLGAGTGVLDLEDFIVSQNLLPLGGLTMLIFCFAKFGWGKKNFLAELHEGQSWKFSRFFLFYYQYLLPVILLAVFVMGYIQIFKQ